MLRPESGAQEATVWLAKSASMDRTERQGATVGCQVLNSDFDHGAGTTP